MEVGRARPDLAHTIPEGQVTVPSTQCLAPAAGMEGGSQEAGDCWSTLKQKGKAGKKPECLTIALMTRRDGNKAGKKKKILFATRIVIIQSDLSHCFLAP